MARNHLPAPHQAVQRIERMILQGDIKPGQKLPSQRDLSQSFGLSRASLREAISVLETLGLVKAEAGRGVYVCDAGPKNGAPVWRFDSQYSEEEVYQARVLIEPEISALASHRLDPTQMEQLHREVASMRESVERRDFATAAQHDSAFHQLLCEASGNRVLMQIYRQLAEVLQESQRRPMVNLSRVHETVREHETILGALEERDAQAAFRAMRRHIIGAASRLGIRIATHSP
jgi:GntR family transcriptional repressor for pyruvate dehydrogenase complex